jgi:hypothetical protein
VSLIQPSRNPAGARRKESVQEILAVGWLKLGGKPINARPFQVASATRRGHGGELEMDVDILFDVGGESHRVSYLLRHRVINKLYSDKKPTQQAHTYNPEKCTTGYSSSTVSCGTGFLFIGFRCDPSSSWRTSEPVKFSPFPCWLVRIFWWC